LEFLVNLVDGPSDGIQQGGHGAGDIGGGVEFGDLVEGQTVTGDLILVIEEDEAEAGVTRGLALFAEELVEAGDGGFDHVLHGSGAVEDVGDFKEVLIHFLVVGLSLVFTLWKGVGHSWGEAHSKSEKFAFSEHRVVGRLWRLTEGRKVGVRWVV
jgi:hypothetical protein